MALWRVGAESGRQSAGIPLHQGIPRHQRPAQSGSSQQQHQLPRTRPVLQPQPADDAADAGQPAAGDRGRRVRRPRVTQLRRPQSQPTQVRVAARSVPSPRHQAATRLPGRQPTGDDRLMVETKKIGGRGTGRATARARARGKRKEPQIRFHDFWRYIHLYVCM